MRAFEPFFTTKDVEGYGARPSTSTLEPPGAEEGSSCRAAWPGRRPRCSSLSERSREVEEIHGRSERGSSEEATSETVLVVEDEEGSETGCAPCWPHADIEW